MHLIQTFGTPMEYLLREIRGKQNKDFSLDDDLIVDENNDEVMNIALGLFPAFLGEEEDEVFERNMSLLLSTLDGVSSVGKYKQFVGEFVKILTKDVGNQSDRKILTLIDLYNLVFASSDLNDLGPGLFLKFLTVAEQSPNRPALLKGRLSSLKETVKGWRERGHSNRELERQVYYTAYKVAKQVGDAKDAQEFIMEFLSLHDASDKSGSVLAEAAQAVLNALSADVDIESVFRLSLIPAVQALKSSQRHAQLYQLFEILLKGTAEDLKQFCASSKVMSQLSIPEDKVWENIRLLTLCSLGRDPGTHTYTELQQALALDDELELEDLVVQAVQRKLIVAKIDSAGEKVRIYQASPRYFDNSEWEAVLKTLKRLSVEERDVLKAL